MKGFIRSEAEFTSLHIQATVIQTERYMLFFCEITDITPDYDRIKRIKADFRRLSKWPICIV